MSDSLNHSNGWVHVDDSTNSQSIEPPIVATSAVTTGGNRATLPPGHVKDIDQGARSVDTGNIQDDNDKKMMVKPMAPSAIEHVGESTISRKYMAELMKPTEGKRKIVILKKPMKSSPADNKEQLVTAADNKEQLATASHNTEQLVTAVDKKEQLVTATNSQDITKLHDAKLTGSGEKAIGATKEVSMGGQDLNIPKNNQDELERDHIQGSTTESTVQNTLTSVNKKQGASQEVALPQEVELPQVGEITAESTSSNTDGGNTEIDEPVKESVITPISVKITGGDETIPGVYKKEVGHEEMLTPSTFPKTGETTIPVNYKQTLMNKDKIDVNVESEMKETEIIPEKARITGGNTIPQKYPDDMNDEFHAESSIMSETTTGPSFKSADYKPQGQPRSTVPVVVKIGLVLLSGVALAYLVKRNR